MYEKTYPFYTLTPCYYLSMLWDFYRVLQASVYETRLGQTLQFQKFPTIVFERF